MADNRAVTGTIKTVADSRERVAFDICDYLWKYVDPSQRDQYLELYAQCLLTQYHPHLGAERLKSQAKGDK